MTRRHLSIGLAVLLAACNTTGTDADQVPSAAAPAQVETLEPAAGTDAAPAAAVAPAPADAAASAAAAPALATAEADTGEADQKAQTYLNCVVGRAAQSAEAGTAHDEAVEVGIDACRNQFREARWAYLATGVTETQADRYGVNLLAFVRTEARSFLDNQGQ
ncbi:MAG: hypothetical protein R3F55_22700 [Alphaproteobacteria bacterium]